MIYAQGVNPDNLPPEGVLGDLAFWNKIDLITSTAPVMSLAQFRAELGFIAPYVNITDVARGLYYRDTTDTTSADDGLSCIINADSSVRYKRVPFVLSMNTASRDGLSATPDGFVTYVTDGTPGFWARIGSGWRKFLTSAIGAVTYIEGTLGIGISAPVGAFEVQANNPAGGELGRFTNNSNQAGRSGAKIGIHQAGVSIWRIGMQGDSDALTFEALNSSVFNEFVRILGAGQGGNMGNVGFSTTSPTSRLHINGATGANQLRLEKSFTPTSSTDAAGQPGDIAWDANYLYVKTAAGAWKRTALSTF